MRVFFSIFIAFFTVYAHADINVNCTNDNCTAGCYWYNGICSVCSGNHYCPDPVQPPQNCPSNFPNSPEGATEPSDCYKATNNPGGGCYKPDGTTNQNCGLFYDGGHFGDGGIPKCWNATGYSTQQYHLENNLCYANTRSCGLFGKSVFFYNLQQVETCGLSTGLANWTANEGWDVSDCKLSPTQEGCELKQLGCISNNFSLKPENETTVLYADGTIQYDAQSGPNTSYYYCDSCIEGHYVNTTGNNKDYQTCAAQGECTFNDCIDDAQGFYVCRCSPVPKGYWLGSNSCNWGNTLSSLDCQPNACPAGKTTEYTATSEPGDCFYTDQTKFCDSKGCFALPDIGSWDEI